MYQSYHDVKAYFTQRSSAKAVEEEEEEEEEDERKLFSQSIKL